MSGENKTSVVSDAFNGMLLALSFLTRVPVSARRYDDNVWKWSVAFYPLCGLVVGVAAILPFCLFLLGHKTLRPPMLYLLFAAPFLYVVISQWMTRMLHFDGFCDCCDAFGSVKATKEERLQIMKDPHIGVAALGGGGLFLAGKIMLSFLVLWKFQEIQPPPLARIMASFVAVAVVGRLSMVVLATVGKYPREKGTAFNVVGKVPWYSILVAALVSAPAFCLLGAPGACLRHAGICAAVAAALVIYWKRKADAKIGGVTGDVLGACCESVELAVLAAFLF